MARVNLSIQMEALRAVRTQVQHMTCASIVDQLTDGHLVRLVVVEWLLSIPAEDLSPDVAAYLSNKRHILQPKDEH